MNNSTKIPRYKCLLLFTYSETLEFDIFGTIQGVTELYRRRAAAFLTAAFGMTAANSPLKSESPVVKVHSFSSTSSSNSPPSAANPWITNAPSISLAILPWVTGIHC